MQWYSQEVRIFGKIFPPFAPFAPVTNSPSLFVYFAYFVVQTPRPFCPSLWSFAAMNSPLRFCGSAPFWLRLAALCLRALALRMRAVKRRSYVHLGNPSCHPLPPGFHGNPAGPRRFKNVPPAIGPPHHTCRAGSPAKASAAAGVSAKEDLSRRSFSVGG